MFCSSLLLSQAAAALKEMYQKHPVLHNTSIVCSFEPKVIYRVTVGCWVDKRIVVGCLYIWVLG
jgi:hypothetical protein